MSNILIIINKEGDEFRFFSHLLNDNATILYIGKKNEHLSLYYSSLVSIGLIKQFHFKYLRSYNKHYIMKNEKDNLIDFINQFDSIYTYGINDDTYKDDIIYLLSNTNKNKYFLSDYDNPKKVVKLTEKEYCLKYNLMLNLNVDVNDNSLETYNKYTNKDIKLYYNKKYSKIRSDYIRSTYIIDIQYALLGLIRHYKFTNVLLYNWNGNDVSTRIETNDINIVTDSSQHFDVVICNSDINLKNSRYVITLNHSMPTSQYKVVEKKYVTPLLEKIYDYDYKSNISIVRPRMEIVLYEKK